jgi:hypothetical protein
VSHALHVLNAGPRAPTAGSSTSKLTVSDAGQLQALLDFRAAVDGNNILKGEWVRSGGCGQERLLGL